MDKPEILYPCWWTYAIIGSDEEDLRLAAGEIVRGTRHRVDFSKTSARKRFVSLHVDIWVESAEERNRFFQAFQSHPAVRMVL